MARAKEEMKGLGNELFLDRRIDDAQGVYSLPDLNTPMTRRGLFGRVKRAGAYTAAAGLTYAASKIESVYADDLVIPKLGYAPTIDQLFSDFNLQQQMLALDLKLHANSPASGEAGIGFDNNNIDCVVAFTSQTKKPVSSEMNIGIDKNQSEYTINNAGDAFILVYAWENVSYPAPDGRKDASIDVGSTNGFGTTTQLPFGFNWDVRFVKSYFNQQQDHIVYAAQIPNSYLGSESGGKFKMFFGVNDNAHSDFPVPGYTYPPESDVYFPNQWANLGTEYPIPEFSIPLPLTTAGLIVSAPLVISKWKMNRINR